MKEAAGDDEVASVGDRCRIDEHSGTIRFIGEVPPTDGVWYGVDWDDQSRGKHDGQKDNVRYFKTHHPTSGSFVRPRKVELGVSVLAAVEERYGRVDDEHGGVLTEEMYVQGNRQRTTVEVVGAKSVNLLQCQFDMLTEVSLRGMPVSRVGLVGAVTAVLPRVTELDISDTLISSWAEIAKITSQLPLLETLNVSDNIIGIAEDMALLQPALGHVQMLFINRCHITWPQMLQLSTAMTSLRTVHACFNQITTVPPSSGHLENLTTLNLEANQMGRWADVLSLSSLVSIENLILNNTGIEAIVFDDVPPVGITKYFPNLRSLSLFHNKISEWASINELNKLARFKELKLRFNPLTLDKTYNEETVRTLIIAKVGGLTALNRSQVTVEERNGAELDYLRKFGKEWRAAGGHQDPAQNHPSEAFTQRHPRYQACIEAHGPCEDEEFVVKSTALKDNLLAVTIDCPQLSDKPPLKKKLPVTMTLQKVKAMVQRIFMANPATLELFYTSVKQPDQKFEMDNDMRELGYFGLVEGDVIHIKF